MKEYLKGVGWTICGLAMIMIACHVLFHFCPRDVEGYQVGLVIAGPVMFCVIVAGIASGLSWLIEELRRR